MRLRFLAAGLLVLLAACSSATPTPTPDVSLAEQRVVYVTPDYAILTIDTDASGRRRVIGGGDGGSSGGVQAQPLPQQGPTPGYTWPTWSPDGSRLAVSRVPGRAVRTIAALVVIEPPSREESYVHETRRGGRVDRVADQTLHYIHWSPDGTRLAFVAPERGRRFLRLYEAPSLDALEAGDPRGIVDNAPIYFVWSPDSSRMLVHQAERLMLVDEDGDIEDLERRSFAYRVPAFSPDSESIAYVAQVDGEEQLVARRLDEGTEVELMRVRTEAVFAWPPSGQGGLAVTLRARSTSIEYDDLWIIDGDTGERQRLYDGSVIAFFWSPDGTKLAIVTPSSGGLRWSVLAVESGEGTKLATFSPSPVFTTYLGFFDQFAPSHLIWSADSKAIVFAGDVLEEGSARGPNRAWVLDVTGEREPVSLAEARLAFFAPPEAR